MSKGKHDLETEDWVDDVEDRRFKEEQEHARRVARREKANQRKASSASEKDSPHPRTAR